jgi:hypothetical protein
MITFKILLRKIKSGLLLLPSSHTKIVLKVQKYKHSPDASGVYSKDGRQSPSTVVVVSQMRHSPDVYCLIACVHSKDGPQSPRSLYHRISDTYIAWIHLMCILRWSSKSNYLYHRSDIALMHCLIS